MFSVSARASGPFSECSVVPGPDAATPLCCQYFPMESEFHAVSPLLSLRVTCSATAASDPSRTSPATMIGIRRNTTFSFAYWQIISQKPAFAAQANTTGASVSSAAKAHCGSGGPTAQKPTASSRQRQRQYVSTKPQRVRSRWSLLE